MVFLKLGLGFLAGVTIPHLVNEMTYMTISNAFLRPHLRYRIAREKLHKDKAVSIQMLDDYVRDVVGSFVMFFFVIGPVVYESYFKQKQLQDMAPKKEEFGKIEDDKYTKMLK
jgi:hypothetical protein